MKLGMTFKYFTLLAFSIISFNRSSGQETHSLYFKGKLDGSELFFLMDKNNSLYWPFTGVRYNDGGALNNIFIVHECGVLDSQRKSLIIGVGFYNKYQHGTALSPQQSQSFLKPGRYPFSRKLSSITDASSGSLVSYLDERNYEWVSQEGDQDSSVFEVTEIVTMEKDGKLNTVVCIKFSCLLYNMYGETKKLEGVMRNILFSEPKPKIIGSAN